MAAFGGGDFTSELDAFSNAATGQGPSGSDEAADPTIRWGLKGILKVIKRENQSLNMLALGEDLTTLGLNLNSPEPLHTTFASPWLAKFY